MRRHELLHVLRAADSITDGRVKFLVIGSQAILGTTEPSSHILSRSMEADLAVVPKDDEGDDAAERYADIVDGAIGNGSPFASTFGYYADGVEIKTADLAPGWEQRLIQIEYDAYGKTCLAECLSATDLAVSKLLAGREKDFEFVDAMLNEQLVEREQLDALLSSLEDKPAKAKAETWLSNRPHGSRPW